MTSRLTTIERWRDSWFRNLSQEAKLLFIYLCDNCDIAGFWEIDMELMAWEIKIDEPKIEKLFLELTSKYVKLDKYIWLKNSLKHQCYVPYNPINNIHKKIIKLFSIHKKLPKEVKEILSEYGYLSVVEDSIKELNETYKKVQGGSRGFKGVVTPDKNKSISNSNSRSKSNSKILNESNSDSDFDYRTLEEPYNKPILSNDSDYIEIQVKANDLDYSLNEIEAWEFQAAIVWAIYKIKYRWGNKFQSCKQAIIPLLEAGHTIEELQKFIQDAPKTSTKTPLFQILKPYEDEAQRKLEKEQEKQRRKKHNAERLKMLQENE